MALWLIYQSGIQESPTASADQKIHILYISIALRMMLIGKTISRIFPLCFTFPVPARIWKLICDKRLNIRKAHEYKRSVPDLIKLVQKKSSLKDSQN
jgi:hypothetical protein